MGSPGDRVSVLRAAEEGAAVIHTFNVFKTKVLHYPYPTEWTPWCSCGWVGTGGRGGEEPAAERRQEFLDHLREATGPRVSALLPDPSTEEEE
jgi:hypothetical protein